MIRPILNINGSSAFDLIDQQRDMASRRCNRRDALKHAVSEYLGDGRRYLQNQVTDALVQVA